MSTENGPTEFVLGSHLMTVEDLVANPETIKFGVAIADPVRRPDVHPIVTLTV
eukprot:SAG31_NODE_6785_length_1889_cov_2.230168_3_plen_53_part_00